MKSHKFLLFCSPIFQLKNAESSKKGSLFFLTPVTLESRNNNRSFQIFLCHYRFPLAGKFKISRMDFPWQKVFVSRSDRKSVKILVEIQTSFRHWNFMQLFVSKNKRSNNCEESKFFNILTVYEN